MSEVKFFMKTTDAFERLAVFVKILILDFVD